jgi:hypothetical protein
MSPADREIDPREFYVLLALALDAMPDEFIARDAAAASGCTVAPDAACVRRLIGAMLHRGWVFRLHGRTGSDAAAGTYAMTDAGRRAAVAEVRRLAELTRIARTKGILPDDS